MQQKIWACRDIDENEVEKLASDAGISMLLARVFVSRGITDVGYVGDFLKPDIKRLHDPFLMDGMEAAAGRIYQATRGGEEILIYGDYDVDGVVSTSMLYNFLRSQGAKVQFFIPERMEDGYGLTMSAVEKIKDQKVSLMVTVDCGITSTDEVRLLQESGMCVVVTDHHECKETLPEAYAILNPHKPGCHYPFRELSGAGVVFKLVQALCSLSECRDKYLEYLDLVALATIADIVPLKDENRIIAAFGLKAMESTRNLGLQALIHESGLADKPMTTYGAAFGLAPRVNAAGRLGSATRSVRLFTTDNLPLAEALAKELDSENRSRQEMEEKILTEAINFIDKNIDLEHEKVLVISGEDWHHGVIGIVASKVLERYNRPCIMISVQDGVGKGSGRSLTCFNLFRALTACADSMEGFGGHEMAAGLTIRAEKIHELRARLNEYADRVLTIVDLLPCIKVDTFLKRDEMTLESVRELSRLAPFGAGNPGPVFGHSAFAVADIRTISAGKHLKLKLKDGDLMVEAIGFNMGKQSENYVEGDRLDAVFSLDINSWNGTEKLQLGLKDIKISIYMAFDKYIVFGKVNDYNEYYTCLKQLYGQEGYNRLGVGELVPERCEFEAVYRYVRTCSRAGQERARKERLGHSDANYCSGCGNRNSLTENCSDDTGTCEKINRLEFADLFETSTRISHYYKVNINYFKLKRIFEIFEELGLLRLEPVGRKGMAVFPAAEVAGVKLENSALYMELQHFRELENK